MKERTFEILDRALRDYIKTGEVITSDRLYRLYDFGIKPAMIRWELSDLSDAGYLTQVHHSGGRLPTDRAYRYFAERILDNETALLERDANGRISDFLECLKENREGEFVEEVSKYLRSFGVGCVSRGLEIYESGLPSLFEQLQIDSKKDLLQVVKDLDRLPFHIKAFSREWVSDNLWPKIFIGRGPLMESDGLSLLAQKIEYNGGIFMFFAVGPKRMDYQKSLRLLSQINRRKNLTRQKKKNGNKKNGRRKK